MLTHKVCTVSNSRLYFTFSTRGHMRQWKKVTSAQGGERVTGGKNQKTYSSYSIKLNSVKQAHYTQSLKGLENIFTTGVLPADQVLIVLQDPPQLRVIVHHHVQGLCTHRGAP